MLDLLLGPEELYADTELNSKLTISVISCYEWNKKLNSSSWCLDLSWCFCEDKWGKRWLTESNDQQVLVCDFQSMSSLFYGRLLHLLFFFKQFSYLLCWNLVEWKAVFLPMSPDGVTSWGHCTVLSSQFKSKQFEPSVSIYFFSGTCSISEINKISIRIWKNFVYIPFFYTD